MDADTTRDFHRLIGGGDRQRPRILLVDDNADGRESVRRLLAPAYDVEEVADGYEALAAAVAERPGLVLADVMTPGLDGFEILRRLRTRSETSRVPVILVAATADAEPRLEALQSSACDYLIKPFSARELLVRVAARLEIARLRNAWDRRIHDSEEQLRIAMTAGRFGSWEYAIDTRAITASDQCKAHFGFAPDQPFTNDDIRRVVHPDDVAGMDAAMADALARVGDYEAEYRCVWPDRSIHWINARGRVIAGDDGAPARLIGVTLDATERKWSDERIASDLQTMTLLQHVGDLCARPDSDRDECLQQVLEAAIRISGADKGHIQLLDASRKTLHVVVQRGFADPFLEFFTCVDADVATSCGAAMSAGARIVVADVRGSALFVGQPSLQVLLDAGVMSVQSTPLVASDARVLGMLSTHCGRPHALDERTGRSLDLLARHTADYLERIAAEQALREADRRKDEFLATLAHELRNPLAPVRTGIQLLRMKGANSDRERITDMMERQVEHIVRLADDLFEASRITSGKINLRKEFVELAAIVRNAVETVAPAIERAGHHLRVELPDRPVWLEGDSVRLVQVVTNLLNNATKYTESTGRITVVGTIDASSATLSVGDSGAGIPQDMLPRVFDLFTQVDRTLGRAQGGMGIGLALVKQLVAMHGGEVEARSDGPGRGSEFIVRLPIASHRPDQTPTTSSIDARGSIGRCVVIDDNRDAADSLGMLLRQLGAEVLIAYDGPTGIEQVRRSRPALLFLDLGMPAMDGFAVAAALRREPEGCELPIVAITGWGQEQDRRRTASAGFNAHLVKPVSFEALLELLASLRVTVDS